MTTEAYSVVPSEGCSPEATSRRSGVLARFADAVRRCALDETGAAATEYVMLTLITVPMIVILFHPDNGFYKAARDQYELTNLLLQFPGP